MFDAHLKELRRARNLLSFCVEFRQLRDMFEHPWGASSWSEPRQRTLVQRRDSYLAS